MPGLDTTCTKPGYLLGRLYATLERIAHRVNDATGNTVEDKRGLAVADPALALLVAKREAPSWIKRLHSRSEGATRAHHEAVKERASKEIAELVDKIGEVGTLKGNSEQQSLFVVGYHHQRLADDRTSGAILTTRQVAQKILHVQPDSARAQLAKWVKAGRLDPAGTDEATGQRLWRAPAVRAIHEARPGQGKGGGRPCATVSGPDVD